MLEMVSHHLPWLLLLQLGWMRRFYLPQTLNLFDAAGWDLPKRLMEALCQTWAMTHGVSQLKMKRIGDSRSSIYSAFCMVNELTCAEMYQIGILFGIISSINRVSAHRKGVIGSICSSSLSAVMLAIAISAYRNGRTNRRPAANICRVFIYVCTQGVIMSKRYTRI